MNKKVIEMATMTPDRDAAVSHDRRDVIAKYRRLVVLTLNLITVAVLFAAMAYILSSGGWTLTKIIMLLAYLTTLPWLSIGFWNAVIGYILLASETNRRQSQQQNDPWALRHDPTAAIISRTAIVMAIRNEDPASAIDRLRAIHDDLQAAGFAGCFDFHILSDTSDRRIAAAEQRYFANWHENAATPSQIYYRRRSKNTGYKAGNIEEFCRRTVNDYDFFLPLDADSSMSGAAIRKLVRIMEANAEIGILQTLVIGAPASTFFTRAFQFGMRHGMRAYTKGSAWWQCDCGPYWGHNALIRMRAFHDHCKLPKLSGTGPLGGSIMSHDQVEAALMRKAGYHVRVVNEELESWEENPPTLPDFIHRDLRWCQGNMQYLQLLNLPGLLALSRIQLLLAILMFVGALGWIGFMLLGLLEIMTGSYAQDYPVGLGLLLLAVIMTMNLAPKLAGLLAVVVSPKQSQRYGGRRAAIVSGVCEFLFSLLLAPIVSLAVAIFIVGLIFGQKIDWRVQRRSHRQLSWSEAVRNFFPQTLFGLGVFLVLSLHNPDTLVWAAPVIAGMVFSIPFAVITTSYSLSAWGIRHRVFHVPEENTPTATSRRDAAMAIDRNVLPATSLSDR